MTLLGLLATCAIWYVLLRRALRWAPLSDVMPAWRSEMQPTQDYAADLDRWSP